MKVFSGSLEDLFKMLGVEDDDDTAESFSETRSNSRFREWALKNKAVFMDMIVVMRRNISEFQEAKKAIGHHYNTELDIIQSSPSSQLWYEQTRDAGWITIGVDRLVHAMPELAKQDMFGIGAGIFPIRGARYAIKSDDGYEAHISHARHFVQWSLVNERDRTYDEILFYLYMLGREGMPDAAAVVLAAGMTNTFLDPEFLNNEGRINSKVKDTDDQNTDTHEKQEAELPEWQRRLFSPPAMACECEMCRLKRLKGGQDVVAHMIAGGDAEYKKIGMNAVGRFLNAVITSHAAELPGVKPEIREALQGFVIREVGAPIFLSREEMRAITEDEDRWNSFVNWGADPVEGKALYQSFNRLVYEWCEMDSDGKFGTVDSDLVNFRTKLHALKAKAMSLTFDTSTDPATKKAKIKALTDELRPLMDIAEKKFGHDSKSMRLFKSLRDML